MYHKIWPELLSALKENILTESDIEESDFIDISEKTSLKKAYSVKSYSQNLICEPSDKHAKELELEKEKEELSYIASKKAVLFNLFGNDSTYIMPNDYGFSEGLYKIKYMSKKPVIRGKNTNVRFDVILNNKEAGEIIVTRLKFFEWIILNNDSIKEQYLDRQCYFSSEAGEVFPEIISDLLSVCGADGVEYAGKLVNFDALHVIKEIIASYNLLEEYVEKHPLKKITIAEVYWRPIFYENLNQYAGRVYLKEKNSLMESDEMMHISKKAVELFRSEFDVELDIKNIDLWQMLFLQDKSEEEYKWMKRYII